MAWLLLHSLIFSQGLYFRIFSYRMLCMNILFLFLFYFRNIQQSITYILITDCQIGHFLRLIKIEVWYNNFISHQGINDKEDIKQKTNKKQNNINYNYKCTFKTRIWIHMGDVQNQKHGIWAHCWWSSLEVKMLKKYCMQIEQVLKK